MKRKISLIVSIIFCLAFCSMNIVKSSIRDIRFLLTLSSETLANAEAIEGEGEGDETKPNTKNGLDIGIIALSSKLATTLFNMVLTQGSQLNVENLYLELKGKLKKSSREEISGISLMNQVVQIEKNQMENPMHRMSSNIYIL